MDSTGVTEGLHHDDAAVLYLSGEVDLLTAPTLRGRLYDAALGCERMLVVDLSAVTFLDCAGLGPLLEARAYLGGRLRLRGVPWPIRHVLRLTGLLATFTILDDTEPESHEEQARQHDAAFAERLAARRSVSGTANAPAAEADAPSDAQPEAAGTARTAQPPAGHHRDDSEAPGMSWRSGRLG
jgi:anti-anti-sigma factor